VDADYGQAGNTAFRRLAGYIFGNNSARSKIPMTAPVIQEKTSEKIPMTAPVIQERSAKGWRMAFVLPARYTLEAAPKPLDPNVAVKQEPACKVAVLRYSGWLSERKLETNAARLMKWIEQKQYRATPPPRSAAYDPPWTLPFLRRNEVHIDLQ